MTNADPYSVHLDAARLCATIDGLCRRIEARFPDSGLLNICQELHAIGLRAEEDIKRINRPNWPLRAIVLLIVFGGIVLLIVSRLLLNVDTQAEVNVADMLQALDAIVNTVFVAAVSLPILWLIENRFKRRRVVQAINYLRSLAHVIDMHQLTKNPTANLAVDVSAAQYLPRGLTQDDLSAYLELCAEALSLTGKVGFLYVQDFHDAEATKAMNDLEDLTIGLANGIWQKIILLKEMGLAALLQDGEGM